MKSDTINEVRYLIDQLKDPFSLFPIEAAVCTLCEAIEEAEEWKNHRMGPWGVARKYWSVEEELCHERIGFLIGSVFVLGQAAITQTVSILNQLRKFHQAQGLVLDNKMSKLVIHAEIDSYAKLSKIVIINAVSNYFKHIFEWPEGWDIAKMKGGQRETRDIVLKIGMKPREMADNLLVAANCIGLFRESGVITKCIGDWREEWARQLYYVFGLTDDWDLWNEAPLGEGGS